MKRVLILSLLLITLFSCKKETFNYPVSYPDYELKKVKGDCYEATFHYSGLNYLDVFFTDGKITTMRGWRIWGGIAVINTDAVPANYTICKTAYHKE
jgi:hypothetical protein